MTGFSREFVEYILLGPVSDRRQLHDSPLLADVWTEFAAEPGKSFDLLITPVSQISAGRVARELDDRIGSDDPNTDPNIAYVDGVVAATLDFPQLLKFVVPLTRWWHDKTSRDELETLAAPGLQLPVEIDEALRYAKRWTRSDKDESVAKNLSAFHRYAVLAGLILWAGSEEGRGKRVAKATSKGIAECLSSIFQEARKAAQSRADEDEDESRGLIQQVAHNRAASPAIGRSVAAVKGDAAKNLFSIDCSGITWAVVDSGIDQSHPAFLGEDGVRTRVKKSFDFSRFRSIVAVGNARPAIRKKNLQKLEDDGLLDLPSNADEILEQLGRNARNEKPTDWSILKDVVKTKSNSTPSSDHGTHVGGILGARGEGSRPGGVCPDINLYDFRILAPDIKDTEFAVIAVLQYIRYVNESERRIVINGANLSLSIPHEVRNYACGRTPVCVECERLVDSGVVVVAAAGNQGYQKFETAQGSFANYAAFSITDPGNTEGVITVGATHRYSPHTYGVSFFSSRGPTGDGRMKPDIVAPGERISGPVLNQEWGDHDGTSMAAPHVSGAAAMVMARYPELIGQPRRVKRILCENATDLGRERSFQGHGMLDILRALQSV